jgi:Na+:H+ antiporter, NhaA family
MESEATITTPIQLITSPFVRFARMEAAGGIVLLASTIVALIWANSPWQHSYHHFLETQVSIGFGNFVITENRHEWINDGLMSLFFFLVGLEIKREILVGELSSLRRAALPFVAALGGMIVPALIYLGVTHGANVPQGWAIPIATDIAFALGLLAFFGTRVPVTLKVFITALAIVDDILAVIVIALFYTAQLNYTSLAIGLGCIAVSLLANISGIRNPLVYATIGVFAWCAVLNSGVHATIAGILLAFTIPSSTVLDRRRFLQQSRVLLDRLEHVPPNSADEHSTLHTLEQNLELVQSPLQRIEHSLQPWVGFLIMPLFALSNAGVNVSQNLSSALGHPLTLGVGLGLVIGKPLGIWLFGDLAVRTRLALPLQDVSSRHIFGAACLCGIGFTMSLFVATLAFQDGFLLDTAKIAILFASLTSGIFGGLLLATSRKTVARETALAA